MGTKKHKRKELKDRKAEDKNRIKKKCAVIHTPICSSGHHTKFNKLDYIFYTSGHHIIFLHSAIINRINNMNSAGSNRTATTNRNMIVNSAGRNRSFHSVVGCLFILIFLMHGSWKKKMIFFMVTFSFGGQKRKLGCE